MAPNDSDSKPDPVAGDFSLKVFLTFLIPSLIGASTFLIPFTIEDEFFVGMVLMADWLMELLDGYLPAIVVVVFWISLLVSMYVKIFRPSWIKYDIVKEIFDVEAGWFVLRILGTVLATLTYYQFGPVFIISDATGGEMLNVLLPVLLAFFFFAALLLPFLVDYGFMEFIGSLVRKPFRVIFNLPGRSAIDATASWFGSGTVGILITMRQYESGFYNQKEAATIATTFSIVSIAFSLVVIEFVELRHMFLEYYSTVIVSGILAAVILPRIYPLSRKPITYYEPVGKQIIEDKQYDANIFFDSLYKAMDRARMAPGPQDLARKSVHNLADIMFSLLPLVFAIGAIALILAEYTPFFTWLSYPMVPFLQLLQLPEAQLAAPATLVGFADMFVPALLVSDLESELTRFVIAALSVSQLIYMSEVGALIIKSKIPLNFIELVIIFLLRTFITLPIIALMAHLFFF